MRFAFLVLPFLAVAAPVEPRTDYDAIIVGGGPAGLSALSGLARVRRNVLLVDSGVYRNGATRHMHDVIGNDGISPAYYRYLARTQIANYGTVSMTNGTVFSIQPRQNNTYFTVAGTYGDKNLTLTARKVVLATGLRDLLPETPGIRENWGKGIFWCPWCDGHEHADQPLGLLGPLTSAPGTVREVLSLNKDIIAFVNGTDTSEARASNDKSSPGWQTYLDALNVTIDNRTISSVERLRNGSTTGADPSLPSHPEFDLFRVYFTDGAPVDRAAFLTSFGEKQYSSLGKDLNLKQYGSKLAVDQTKGLVTSVPGIYAIGDCNSDNATNVPHALFSGKRTAVFLHVQLEREDSVTVIASAKNRTIENRSLDEHARELWDTINTGNDVLYAGSFDQ